MRCAACGAENKTGRKFCAACGGALALARFLRWVLPGALRAAAAELARFLHAQERDLAFVENATTGVNAVLRSIDFRPGDEILATTHTYNAVRQTIRDVCRRTGAVAREAAIGLPVRNAGDLVSPISALLGRRTRLLVLDHIASPTGLVFPVQRLAALARARGAVMSDHALLAVDGGILHVAVQLLERPREEDGHRDGREPLAVLLVRERVHEVGIAARRRLGQALHEERVAVPGEDAELEAARLGQPRHDQSSAITRIFAGPPGWAASHRMAAT